MDGWAMMRQAHLREAPPTRKSDFGCMLQVGLAFSNCGNKLIEYNVTMYALRYTRCPCGMEKFCVAWNVIRVAASALLAASAQRRQKCSWSLSGGRLHEFIPRVAARVHMCSGCLCRYHT